MTGPIEDLERDIRDLVLLLLKVSAPPPADLARDSTPQWDSLKHMEIVFALEDRYGVRFDESEFSALVSPVTIAAALRRHLAA